MLRFFGRRVLLLAFTLAVASVLIFAITNVLPGDVARIILGPFAPQDAVTRLNAELGTDRPVVIRYVEWLAGVAQGDWGRSYAFNTAVFPLVLERLGRSLLLAASGLAVLVPLAIASGVAAARREGGIFDRVLSTVSLAVGALPEFVTGVFLILVFGIWLAVLPIQALPPEGAGPLTIAAHLVLPIGCLVLLLFAYLFRMTRASMIEALAADYTRTATLKGLPPRTVIWRHVLRNALLPTVTVIGAQIGWLVGGLVVVETLFKYPGIGSLIHFAATNKDIPLLVGCSLAITFVFALGNLAADLLYAVLNPRVRHGRTLTEGRRQRRTRARFTPVRGTIPLAIGVAMVLVWVATALGAPWLAPYPPAEIDFLAISQPPSSAHWFGTDQLGRDMLSRVMHGGTYVLTIAPAATLLGLVLGTAIGLTTAWFGSWVDEVVMRVLDAVMAFPIVILAMLALTFLGTGTGNVILVIGLVFAPLIARTVRAAALVEARKEYVQAAQLRGEGSLYIMAVELLPNVRGPLIVEGTVRLGYAVFTSATLGFLGLGVQPPTPDWGLMVSENQALLTTAPWTVLFPATGIAWVVVAIGLAADGLKEYLEP